MGRIGTLDPGHPYAAAWVKRIWAVCIIHKSRLSFPQTPFFPFHSHLSRCIIHVRIGGNAQVDGIRPPPKMVGEIRPPATFSAVKHERAHAAHVLDVQYPFLGHKNEK